MSSISRLAWASRALAASSSAVRSRTRFSSCAFCSSISCAASRCSVMSVHSETKPRLGMGTPRTARIRPLGRARST